MSAAAIDDSKARPAFNAAGLISFLFWAVLATLVAVWLLRSDGWPARVISSLAVRGVLAALFAMLAGIMAYRKTVAMAAWAAGDTHLTTLEEFKANGAGPLPADAPADALYLDLMKRAVMNLIYEDPPVIFYDDKHEPIVADRYRLDRRVMGEDSPTEAHTMVGVHRLTNLQQCVEQLLKENVPGDLLEAGVLRGGASIFLRAILKAHHSTDRRVFACDTFRKRKTPKPSLLIDTVLAILSLLSYIPAPGLHRWLIGTLHRKINPESRSFPVAENPSPELIRLTMIHMRTAHKTIGVRKDQTGIEAVKSRFAAYGLLDDQVQFLQGFFSDTLPTAPISQLALVRLDGDTYESTLDILKPLYPKLSKGGYCIVDDYFALTDCQKAVDEYRAQHGITDEIHRIDNLAVYWRKS